MPLRNTGASRRRVDDRGARLRDRCLLSTPARRAARADRCLRVVISEEPAGTPPSSTTFRNATASSGTRPSGGGGGGHRTQRRVEHGPLGCRPRPRGLAVPGSIRSRQSSGTNLLIRDGVRPFLGIADLLGLSPSFARRPRKASSTPCRADPAQARAFQPTAPGDTGTHGNRAGPPDQVGLPSGSHRRWSPAGWVRWSLPEP